MTGAAEPGGASRGSVDPRLVDTISALRDEVAGLREASVLRAIIEQAKGVLMERDRISADEAFAQLRTMSQEHNVRLVEVAATVVGVTAPPSTLPLDRLDEVIRAKLPPSLAPSQAWRDFQQQPGVSTGMVGAVLDVVASGAEQGEDAVALLAEVLQQFQVCAVVLYRRMPDESLALVGSAGIPLDVISSWSRLPPAVEFPYVAAVVHRCSYFWADPAERMAQFPALSGVQAAEGGSAVIPILEGGEPVGAAGLLWQTSRSFSPEQQEELSGLVQRVSRMVLRSAASTAPELSWLGAVLRLHLDPWILLDVVPSATGGVRDFVVVAASANTPGGLSALGQRLLVAWPFLASEGTFEALSELASGGGFWTTTVSTQSDALWGTPGSRVRATRVGRRLVIVWRAQDATA